MAIDIGRVREWMDKNSAAVTIAAVLILVIALLNLYWCGDEGGSPGEAVDTYFWSVDKQELFLAKNDQIPPITAPEGGVGVRAYVYSCGDCSDAQSRFVGYVERYTDEYKDAMKKVREAAETGSQPPPEVMQFMEEDYSKHREVSGDGGKTWHAANTEEGRNITDAVLKMCEGKGGKIKPCHPQK